MADFYGVTLVTLERVKKMFPWELSFTGVDQSNLDICQYACYCHLYYSSKYAPKERPNGVAGRRTFHL